MNYINPFSDERLDYFCAFCGGIPDTTEHVIPKVFLDKPYPENLPSVGSCHSCNNGASLDEEYVACLVEVLACGGSDPKMIERKGIGVTLARKPNLAARLNAIRDHKVSSLNESEWRRIRRVIEKIGKAIWTYETSETANTEPADISCLEIEEVADQEILEFYSIEPDFIFPEIGSRLFHRILKNLGEEDPNPWQTVQPERFKYYVSPSNRFIRMEIRSFLLAEVRLSTT